ncbi:MAG: hypothetical protein KAS62_11100 [Candidatus Delongbacteria bacterium]|nr:hypothetical protein [Candidatus Delongbacteria bacterium]
MYKRYGYLILLVLLQTILLSKDLISITSYGDEFYFFDGFEGILEIYSKDNELVRKKDLSNISMGSTADLFIKYNELNSYLYSSISGMIYLLDENYLLRSSQDLYKLFDINFYNKLYPVNYNSLVIATEELDKFYLLENKKLNEILDLSETAIDFFLYEDSIFILFKDKVEIYLTNAIYQRSVPFKDIKEPMKIFCCGNGLYIMHKDGIDRVSIAKNIKDSKKYQTRMVTETGIQDLAIVENKIAVIKDNKILFRVLSDR